MKFKAGRIIQAGLVLLCLTSLAHADESLKKGVSLWVFKGTDEAVKELQVRWVYDWGVEPGFSIPQGIEFVPMIWSGKQLNSKNVAKAKKNGRVLLGFNEPDRKDQANMSVKQALDLWPQMQATGMRLGSPAPSINGDSTTGWMGQFMKGVQEKGYRVDFICLHYYSSNYTDPTAATLELKQYLQKDYQLYHKPIWLTEFALTDWKNPATPEQQQAFIKRVLPMLEELSYVERYAWFALPPHEKGDEGALATSNLCDSEGVLNSLGIVYQHGSTQ